MNENGAFSVSNEIYFLNFRFSGINGNGEELRAANEVK